MLYGIADFMHLNTVKQGLLESFFVQINKVIISLM